MAEGRKLFVWFNCAGCHGDHGGGMGPSLVTLGDAKPVGVVASPDGRTVYVANGHDNSVAVVDAATHEVVANIPVGERPWGIAVTPDGRRVYTANGGSNDVSVIDTATRKVIHAIQVGKRLWGVAIAP